MQITTYKQDTDFIVLHTILQHNIYVKQYKSWQFQNAYITVHMQLDHIAASDDHFCEVHNVN